MVLTKDQAEVNPKGFLKTKGTDSFIVLDASSVLYGEETELFGYSIEILNSIRVISKANKMCADFKSDFRIDTEIYYKAMDAVLNNIPFSDIDLENYIKSEQKKEDFLTFSRSLAAIEEQFYLPYTIDLILLGLNIGTHNKLDKFQIDALHESYGDIAYEVRFKRMEIEDFISKAKKLLNSSNLINIAAE